MSQRSEIKRLRAKVRKLRTWRDTYYAETEMLSDELDEARRSPASVILRHLRHWIHRGAASDEMEQQAIGAIQALSNVLCELSNTSAVPNGEPPLPPA